MREYHQAGRAAVKTGVVAAGDVIIPEMRCEIIKDTVIKLTDAALNALTILKEIHPLPSCGIVGVILVKVIVIFYNLPIKISIPML